MLTFTTHEGHIVFVLEEENIKRLKEGKPIHFSLAEISPAFGQYSVMIHYTHDMEKLVNEVRRKVKRDGGTVRTPGKH